MIERLEQILLRVSLSAHIDCGDISHASRLIIDSCCEGLEIARAGIWLLDETSENIQCQLLMDKGNDLTSEDLVLSRESFPKYFAALDTERTIAAHNAEEDPSTAEFKEVYLKPLGIKSMLDVPIRHRGKMKGVICCEHRGDVRQWLDDELVFASAMADLYGRAMSAQQREKYEQELIAANHALESKVEERTKELKGALSTLKDAQTKLIESEKMAALGTLVAGVAHEVNTPLGIAITSVTHCLDEVQLIEHAYKNDELEEENFASFIDDTITGLKLATSNLERAAKLIHDFKRTAADQESLDIEIIDLGDYLDQSLGPLRPMLRKQKIELHLELEENLTLKTCPGIISQITTNLVSNTLRHAFPDTHNAVIKKIHITCASQGEKALVQYKDNGVGVSNENKNSIFDPFYTTARDLGGTGLGLSITYNLITQNLNGEIAFESKPGQGVSYDIKIPMNHG